MLTVFGTENQCWHDDNSSTEALPSKANARLGGWSRTLDVAMEGGVVIIIARSERKKVFARLWGTVAVELHFNIAQGRVQRERHRFPASLPQLRCFQKKK